jgi:hypothetical protein
VALKASAASFFLTRRRRRVRRRLPAEAGGAERRAGPPAAAAADDDLGFGRAAASEIDVYVSEYGMKWMSGTVAQTDRQAGAVAGGGREVQRRVSWPRGHGVTQPPLCIFHPWLSLHSTSTKRLAEWRCGPWLGPPSARRSSIASPTAAPPSSDRIAPPTSESASSRCRSSSSAACAVSTAAWRRRRRQNL